jgi:hypothetical protein
MWPALSLPIGVAKRYPIAVVRDFGLQSLHARSWTMWSLLSDPAAAGELEGLRDLPGDAAQLLLHARDDSSVSVAAEGLWATVLPAARHRVEPRGGHQFLLRTGFRSLAQWLLDES